MKHNKNKMIHRINLMFKYLIKQKFLPKVTPLWYLIEKYKLEEFEKEAYLF